MCMRATPCVWSLLFLLALVLSGCSKGQSSSDPDGGTGTDIGITDAIGDGDAPQTILDGREPDACAGNGCPCTTDDPCIQGNDQTACIGGFCQPGCSPNVPCANPGEKCCNNQCINGCCDSADCPPGQICNTDTHTCKSCTTHNDCGPGARCCGEPGAMSCFVGNCCEYTDCAPDWLCADHTCRAACDKEKLCNEGEICCQGACFPGDCCANPQCADGQVCVDNKCATCTEDPQCGPGNICEAGECVIGCSGEVLCTSGSVCCGSGGMCKPGDPSCQGSCIEGSCCTNADCTTAGESCGVDNNCHEPCQNHTDCGPGENCCGGMCFSDACVSTLAGSGRGGPPDQAIDQAYINGVYGMVEDGSGSLFFTEWQGGSVRVVNNSNGNIGSVAPGTVGRLTSGIHGCKAGPIATAEMRLPIGLARDVSGNLYVADYYCATIWKISSNYSTVSLLAGKPGARDVVDGLGDEARFDYPRGLTYGADGMLYISEHNAHVIRQVSLSGQVKTVAGQPFIRGEADGDALTTALFDRPSGLVMDAGGVLFVGDWESGAVRKIDGVPTGSGVVTTIVPTAPDPDPDPRRIWIRKYGYAAHSTLSVASGWKVYINFWNDGIWRLDPPSSGSEWIATKIVDANLGIASTLDPAGNFWIGGWVHGEATSYSNTIQHYETSTGSTLQSIGQPGHVLFADGTTEATFGVATCDGAITVDDAENVWIADRCASRVRKITPDGTVTSFGTGRHAETAGDATTAEFCEPSAIAADGNTIYVANLGCGMHIMKIDDAGGVSVLGTTCAASEVGIGETGGDLCPRVSTNGGMVIDNTGNIFVTTSWESGAGRSLKYNKSYWDGMPMIVKIPSYGSGTATFFAGTPNNTFDPATPNTCRDGPLGTGQFGTWPYGLAIDSGGYLYVGDSTCGVRKVAPDGTLTTLENSFGAIAAAIGKGPDGAETLFVSRGDEIWTVHRLTGASAWYAGGSFSFDNHFRDGGLSFAKFWGPYSLAVHSSGRIVVLDRYNNRVRVIHP